MTGDNIERVLGRFADRIGAFAYMVEVAYATTTVNTVDEYAKEFKNSVEKNTPSDTGDLIRSIKLKRTVKKGVYGKDTNYGWVLMFDGYTKEQGVAFQLIANTLNAGRKAGISDNGRPISSMEALKFIDKQLAVLRQINPKVEQNMRVGGWSIDDEDLTLNDGTKIKIANIMSISSAAISFNELKQRMVIIGAE